MQKKNIIVSATVAMLLCMPHAAMADDGWTWGKTFKWGGKALKKVILPVTVVIGATADGAEAYMNGEDAYGIAGASAKGAGERIYKSIVETGEDLGTIASGAAKESADMYNTYKE